MSEVERYLNEIGPAFEPEVLDASPWRYTETGLPVFVSESYEQHEAEWANKEQEGNKILWEMAAIAYSLVGLSNRGHKSGGLVKSFAGSLGVGATRVYDLAGTYSLRVQLEKAAKDGALDV